MLMMTASRRDEDEVLSALLNFKGNHPRRPTWVNAQQLAPHVRLPVPQVARVLRQLEIQGFLELAPQMYGSSTDPEEQVYGLTHEGGRRAAYAGRVNLDYVKTRGDVLSTMRFALIKEGTVAMSAAQLALTFRADPVEVVQVMRSLQADGYISIFEDMGMADQDALYQLTQTGHHVADYWYREGRFPPPTGGGGATTNTITNHGVMGAAVQGNANTVTATYAPGVDGPAFAAAVAAFQQALQRLTEADEKELAELRLRQLQRTVEAGQPSQSQWEKFTTWVTSSPAAITGGAVLWNAASAIGNALGYPIPPAPEGLGQ
jgi:hypothetical protein